MNQFKLIKTKFNLKESIITVLELFEDTMEANQIILLKFIDIKDDIILQDKNRL